MIASAKPSFKSFWDNEAAVIEFQIERKDREEHRILLNFDRHWDNPSSDQSMMKRHMQEAIDIGAPIFDGGDFFCAMQGKYDKRSSKGDLREEHKSGRYLDRLVDTAAEFLEPYSKNIAFMAPGNHETSIQGRHETDLTDRLAGLLRRSGAPTIKHRYSGFTRISFRRRDGKLHSSKVMWHTHGYGGGGPVTMDMIQTSRQANYLAGVDIVCSGHTHDDWSTAKAVRGLSQNNNILRDEILFVKVPSAKDKWGKSSWEDEKGMPPKPLGSYWLRFKYCAQHDTFFVDAERAR